VIDYRWRYFDPIMLATTLVLMGFGVVAVWSAMGGGSLTLSNNGVQQALFGAIGVTALLIIANMDYRFFGSLAWLIYIGGLLMLLAVLVVGIEIYGARRWFDLGITTLQPSEFGKIATAIALAWFISSRGETMRQFGNFFVSLLIVAVPASFVFREPDLGTASVYLVIWASMMLVTRTRFLYLLGLAAVAIPAVVAAWRFEFFFHDYQKRRLLIAFNPESDAQGEGYNIIQAKISIGSGGLLGNGLEGGSQSRLDLLKVRESDFIFAHVSGMFGYIGMVALFVCYVLLIWRCLRVAEIAKDSFGQCFAIGISGMLFYQAFVNIGMNMAILPVTGITLPFVSQGASSVVAFLVAQGLLQSILMRHKKLAFQPD
jgi:rod shape determining protein RodA